MQSLLLQAVTLVCIMTMMANTADAKPGHVLIRRTPTEFNSLLSELKSKGIAGRMRFGKRESAVVSSPDHTLDPDIYSPDRYIWLQ
ncbi:hypothetical protein QR680_000218 [Steinernema hermaphroditum]|uniref:Uncharacterized protein n=1 Tax=Steinernema hermaphroditum TaxID=289476 RepID=A0AA39LDQ9_9BILA|nr:hypothetical protein QR680_000218 [Steinernema hermaphroditum]